MCQSLQCPEFLPCIKCGKNAYLNEKKYCVSCQHAKSQLKIEARRKQYAEQLELMQQEQAEKSSEASKPKKQQEPEAQRQIPEELPPTDADTLPERKYSVTYPGTPPKELNASETEFYYKRWSEFKGYYSNPAAEFAVHQIILEELYISDLTARGFALRGERAEDNVKARQVAYQMLDILKRQLPDKESEELSDYEKSMAAIYDKCIEEKKKRYIGGVSRFFSPSAVALAPNLIHPIDPADILARLGFEPISVQQVIEKYETIPAAEALEPTGENLDVIMAFLGYRMKEKYAMEFKTLDFDDVKLTVDEA